MNHILEYEAMTPGGAGALPPMPDFLKQAGAKAEYVRAGGPVTKDETPNAWTIEVKTMAKDIEKCRVIFYPTGGFKIYVPGLDLNVNSNKGTWKAQSGSSFTIGRTQIKGVSMQFSTLFGLATFD